MISTPSSASPTLYHEGYLPLDLPSHIEVIDVRSTLSTPTASSLSLLRELAASVYSSPSSSHACTPAVIVFTSGTTGRPKGAQLSLRSLLFQAYAKLQPPVSYNSGTKLLLNMPLCHVGGLISMLAIVLCSGSCLLPPTPTSSVNTLAIVPAMLDNFPPTTPHQPNIVLLLVGGSSLTPILTKRARTLFPRARIVQTYACTEATTSMTYLPLPPPPHSPANSVGKPYSNHIEVGVFSLTGSRLPDGQVGIIGTRGPHLMLGYIGFPPHNSTEFYMTNDLGYFHSPSSTFCFVGRASDTVRTGGETVVCAEVEREVTRLDLGLRECAVFGIDDLKSAMGEVVCVAVVPSAGVITSLSIEKALKGRWALAGYKRPRRVFVVGALPRNSNGKIVKDALRLKFGGGGLSRL